MSEWTPLVASGASFRRICGLQSTMRDCGVGGGDVLEETNTVVQTGFCHKQNTNSFMRPSSPLWILTLSTEGLGYLCLLRESYLGGERGRKTACTPAEVEEEGVEISLSHRQQSCELWAGPQPGESPEAPTVSQECSLFPSASGRAAAVLVFQRGKGRPA